LLRLGSLKSSIGCDSVGVDSSRAQEGFTPFLLRDS